MSLTSAVSVNITASSTNSSNLGLGTTTDLINKNYSLTLASGTATGQCDLVYSLSGTLTSSTATNFNIGSGTLKDPFGATLAYARLKVLYINNKAATETNNNLVIGNASAAITTLTSASGTISLPAGGVLLMTAPLAVGYLVTATTADVLKVTPGSGSVPYEIIMLGCSA